MTPATSDPLHDAPPPDGSTPFSGRTVAVLLLLLALVAGFSAGIALDRVVLVPHAFDRAPFGPGRGGWPPHGDEHRGFRERFAKAVGLSAEQQERIDTIMEQQLKELRGVRRQVQPQVDSVLARMRRQIDSVLTPEQRRRAESLRRNERALRGERPPMGPPGSPGNFGPPPGPGEGRMRPPPGGGDRGQPH
jgi:Spy/CpxP family protein refolding chaperone